MNRTEYIDTYFKETAEILNKVDRSRVEEMIKILTLLRDRGGRLFILGVGGSASNASHAVNDFRKISGIEAYTPVDNVAELTARTNDDGFETVFVNWLKVSKLNNEDVIMVLSVGGGTETTSKNLVTAMNYAKEKKAGIVSIVSRDGGAALKLSDACIHIPVVDGNMITPLAESFQSVILHLVVNALNVR
ncbi:MAG TPA: SIS domain-containing protein [Candidatus Omnitrophota bacterium]|nr:SIS domain-containing protein [Candidatus Omnitrophota bacterium]HPS20100.1 SIS domain-containing protein [Candidatus Omnitrophota bacterium]